MPGYKVSVELVQQNVQVGVCANSLDELKRKIQEKFSLPIPLAVFLEDGTLVCDDDYFGILEPQTKLVVRPAAAPVNLGHSLGRKRASESGLNLLPPVKRMVHAAPSIHAAPPPSTPPQPYYTHAQPHSMAQHPMMYYCMQNRPPMPSFIPGPGPPNVVMVPGHPPTHVQRFALPPTLQHDTVPCPVVAIENPYLADCTMPPQRRAPPLIRVDTAVMAAQGVASPTVSNHTVVSRECVVELNPPPSVGKPSVVSEGGATTPSRPELPRLQPISSSKTTGTTTATATSRAITPVPAPPSRDKAHEHILNKIRNYIQAKEKASKLSELRIRKDSTDEGYSSGCPTASPSPSTTETSKLPVVIQEESEVTTSAESGIHVGTASSSLSLTAMLASQPIPEILRADLMETACDTSSDVDVECVEGSAEPSILDLSLVADVTDEEVDVVSCQENPPTEMATLTATSPKAGAIEPDVEACKESVPSDMEAIDSFTAAQEDPPQSLVVTIPVLVKNGHIYSREKLPLKNTTDESTVLSECEVMETGSDNESVEHVNTDIKADSISQQESPGEVVVSAYASEEITCTSLPQCTAEQGTSLPQCTAEQVHNIISSLFSVALASRSSNDIQTDSEIRSLLSSVSKSSVKQTVLLDSALFDSVEQDYVHLDDEDVQDILSLSNNSNERGSTLLDISDIANEVVVSDKADTLSESNDIVALLTNSAVHVSHVPEVNSPVRKTVDSILVHADTLSETHSSLIKDFLSGSPTDPRLKCKTFPIKRLASGEVLSLQLNFLSGEWQGYISCDSLSPL